MTIFLPKFKGPMVVRFMHIPHINACLVWPNGAMKPGTTRLLLTYLIKEEAQESWEGREL